MLPPGHSGSQGTRHRTWALALRTNPSRNTLPFYPRHHDMHLSSTCHLQRHKSREFARRDQHAGRRDRRSIPNADACRCPKCACPSLHLSMTHAYAHTHPSPCFYTSTRFSVFSSTQKPGARERSRLSGCLELGGGSGFSASLAGWCWPFWRLRVLAWAPREAAWPVNHRRPAADWCSRRRWPRERAGGCAASIGPGGWQPLGTLPHAPARDVTAACLRLPGSCRSR